jgi:hypothetical protein
MCSEPRCYTYTHTHTHTHAHTHTHTHTHTYTHTHTHTQTHRHTYVCMYVCMYVYQVRTHAQKYFIKLARSRKQSQSSGLPISSDAMSNPDREDMVHVFIFYKLCVLCLHNMFFAYFVGVLNLQNISLYLPTKYMFCTCKLCVSSAAMSNCLRFLIKIHISMQHLYMGSIHDSIDM